MTWFRKYLTPWKAADCFASEEEFRQWLSKRLKALTDVRVFVLLIAGAFLVAGYILDRRPIMLWTIAPLLLVLLLSWAISRIEALQDGQNNSET